MKYTIVKYAEDSYWENIWEEDPKQTGVSLCDSAIGTYTAVECGMESFYYSKEDAELMCGSMRTVNPCVGYAVCILVDTVARNNL